MKQYIKRNAIPLGVMALAVIVSIFIIAGRWRTESANKTYDVVVDYTELEYMVEQSDHDMTWWLEQFKDIGITKVGLTEENLITLMEDSPMNVTAAMMDEVTQDVDWRENYPESFIQEIDRRGYDRFDVIVEVRDTPGYDACLFVTQAVESRFPSGSYFCGGMAGEAYIFLDGSAADALYGTNTRYGTTKGNTIVSRKNLAGSMLMAVSLGLMPEKVELIQSAGMDIIPRTLCYSGYNGTQFAEAVVRGYEEYGIIPDYVICGGEAIIGADDGVDLALDYIQSNQITIGLIETNVQRENISQLGVEDVVRATDLNAIRVFSLWDYIQYRYQYYGYEGAEAIVTSIFHAIMERNVRVIYFKPIKQTNDSFVYITDMEVYRSLFNSLDQRLAPHGISRGQASVMDNYQIPSLALLAIGLGAGAGGALLPDTFLPMKRKWTLALMGLAAVCVAVAWRIIPNTYRFAASFASAVVFACLAVAFFLLSAKRTGEKLDKDAALSKILPRSAAILAVAVAISLAGGMMTAAPLSSTDFMLELGVFRGVKAAQLLPLGFFCLLFVSYYGLFQKERKGNHLDPRDFLTVLKWNIPVWSLFLVAAIGMVGSYYLARTGHETNATVSDVEIIFRNSLESLVLARPRLKEFLVAFPSIMLAVYCAVRRLPFWTALFGLAGTIGLTSVCNTFMHIHTPLYLGFARTACSLALGIAVGVIFILCFEGLLRLTRMAVKKYGKAEH